MALQLAARDVARTNVEKIDLLGAFNGATMCAYHYRASRFPEGCGCAIGIMDVEGRIPSSLDGSRLLALREKEIITCEPDDWHTLRFIQNLHDALIQRRGVQKNGDDVRYKLDSTDSVIPHFLRDLVADTEHFDTLNYKTPIFIYTTSGALGRRLYESNNNRLQPH